MSAGLEAYYFCSTWKVTLPRIHLFTQGASRETDVFETDITEQVEGVEAWVEGS